MHQLVFLSPTQILVCFDLWSDLVPAVLFGALVSAAGVLMWHQRGMRVMRSEQDQQEANWRRQKTELEELRTEHEQEEKAPQHQLDQGELKEEITVATLSADGHPSIESEPLPPEQVFYMPQPNRNGRFMQSGRHSDEEKAIYAFRLQADNPSMASFEFVARDIYLQVALGNEPDWINAACERTNLPGANTSQVKTLSPGHAVLHGDEWEITRKAHITYL